MIKLQIIPLIWPSIRTQEVITIFVTAEAEKLNLNQSKKLGVLGFFYYDPV